MRSKIVKPNGIYGHKEKKLSSNFTGMPELIVGFFVTAAILIYVLMYVEANDIRDFSRDDFSVAQDIVMLDSGIGYLMYDEENVLDGMSYNLSERGYAYENGVFASFESDNGMDYLVTITYPDLTSGACNVILSPMILHYSDYKYMSCEGDTVSYIR
jgi:hypothetical protein